MTEKRIPLQVPAYLTGYKSLTHSLRLTFDVQEDYRAEILVEIMKLHREQRPGWLFFGIKKIQVEDIANAPDIKVEADQKSPSKRLRDRMYVYYKEKYGKVDGFDLWYIGEMDRIGQRYLDSIS